VKVKGARLLPLLAIAGLLAAAPAAAAPSTFTRHLNAGEHVKAWKTPQRWGPGWTVFIDVYVGGRLVPDHSQGCRTQWTGHGVAVQARVCGHGAVPIRLRYVSYQGRRRMTVRYYAVHQQLP
jgi:hypothetical protein